MKPSRVAEVLQGLLKTRWAAFVWGPPGAGKSSVVRSVGEQTSLPVLDIRAPLLDPTDLRGLPYLREGLAVWAPPSFLPSDMKSEGILFFDELNAASPLVQASLYQLILDRRLGEYVLPPGWSIVAAGNRSEDASVVFRMPSALANRFIHIDFEVDFEDWSDWALKSSVHPIVMAFLRLRRELLLDTKHMDKGFPTPRSWEMASDAIKLFGTVEAAADVLFGTVGQGAALELSAFARKSITAAQVEALIQDPAKASLPSGLGDVYALVAHLASRGGESVVANAAGVLLGRLKPEMAILLARQMLKVRPSFVSDTGFRDFAKQHMDLLQ
jgi:MoxR-like ATPase